MGADLYRVDLVRKNEKQYGKQYNESIRVHDTMYDALKKIWPDARRWWQATTMHIGEAPVVPPNLEPLTALVEKSYTDMNDLYNKIYDEYTYFRDSYNDSSILWQLGLSWWHDVMSVLTDDDGNMRPSDARRLSKLVSNRQLPTLLLGSFKEEEREEWREYFTKKQQRLIRFLEKAVEDDATIECSL